jgi:hypothetical protein
MGILLAIVIIGLIFKGLFENGIIQNDFNNVADKIIHYQENKFSNLEDIIQYLVKDSKNSKYNYFKGVKLYKKDKDDYFHFPEDIKLMEENNEIIINYKKKKYNINKVKYIE